MITKMFLDNNILLFIVEQTKLIKYLLIIKYIYIDKAFTTAISIFNIIFQISNLSN